MKYTIIIAALAALASAAPAQRRQTGSVEIPGTSPKTVDAPAETLPGVASHSADVPKQFEVDGPLSDPVIKRSIERRQKVKVGLPDETVPDTVSSPEVDGPTVDPPAVTVPGSKDTTINVGGPVP